MPFKKTKNIKIGDLIKIVGLKLRNDDVLFDILKREIDFYTKKPIYVWLKPKEKLPNKVGIITRILKPYENRKNYIVYEFLCGQNLYFTSTIEYLKKIN